MGFFSYTWEEKKGEIENRNSWNNIILVHTPHAHIREKPITQLTHLPQKSTKNERRTTLGKSSNQTKIKLVLQSLDVPGAAQNQLFFPQMSIRSLLLD